jgi:hypothetical protein
MRYDGMRKGRDEEGVWKPLSTDMGELRRSTARSTPELNLKVEKHMERQMCFPQNLRRLSRQ